MKTRMPLGFRAEISYVCPAWVKCRAENLMWQATPEDINAMSGPFFCTCGLQDSIRITAAEAVTALRAAGPRVFKGEN